MVAPAGAGAREAVLLLVLATVLSPGSALVVALVSRLLLTVSDLGIAAAFGARLTRPAGAVAGSSPGQGPDAAPDAAT